ncbi:glutathione S-transferase family protein [Pendulispora brunnea]|uniref:Glutathione S-transferase family protein n=1 Tax=Pendulispora brunnea TaxID=2905690 RepID=A0ABZ2KQC6_9BACT
MAITLYYAPMSSATRAFWALEELGIPFEKVKLDLRAGDQKKPEYLKINPNGKVPALVDGEAKIFENLAILFHLGERYGVEKGLWPKADSSVRAEAYSWSVWGLVELVQGARHFALHADASHFPGLLPPERRVGWIAEQARKEWEQNAALLEARLENRAYILGDAFSLADVTVAGNAAFGLRMAGLPMGPRATDWVGRCMARPAFARSMAG